VKVKGERSARGGVEYYLWKIIVNGRLELSWTIDVVSLWIRRVLIPDSKLGLEEHA
jgi:hypothetical protein